MKPLKLNAFLLLLLSVILLSSCRTEDEEIINPEQEQNLVANSVLADLLTRTSLNDGSIDNILDNANCFTVQLPVTVFIEGLEILVDSEEDFQTIEDVFDDFDGEVDTLDFVYPITIVLTDFTEIVINSAAELAVQAENCSGENEEDDDIECIDFQYPLSYSVFNTDNELVDTVTITNDAEHYAFLDNIDENDIISINFPFTLILEDGSTIVVNSVVDLEDAIEAAINACDEDDDNDYDDDDCDDCDTDDLLDAFTSCDSFEVDKLERNDEDLDEGFEDFSFQFFSNGSITINDGSSNYEGSWTAEGEGQNITVTIDVPEFPIFNDAWNLHEISAYDDEVKVDLRKGDDRLRFKCDDDDDGDIDDDDCDDCTTDALLGAFMSCENGFEVDKLERDDQDLEDQYQEYVFTFNADGIIAIDADGTSLSGTWSSSGNGNDIEVMINTGLEDFDDAWTLHEIETENGELQIDLRQANGDRLRFECDD